MPARMQRFIEIPPHPCIVAVMFGGMNIDPADAEGLLLRFGHGAYPTLYIVLAGLFALMAIRFRKKRGLLGACIISFALMCGLSLRSIMREVLVSELSSEDDLLA